MALALLADAMVRTAIATQEKVAILAEVRSHDILITIFTLHQCLFCFVARGQRLSADVVHGADGRRAWSVVWVAGCWILFPFVR